MTPRLLSSFTIVLGLSAVLLGISLSVSHKAPNGGVEREVLAEKVTSIDHKLVGKSYEERASLKAQEIVAHTPKTRLEKGDYAIDIVDIRYLDGGVSVYARVFENGQQLGFGKDGSVDIERFRIFNPPLLVPDPNGGIYRYSTSSITGKVSESRYREDPQEAIRQVIEQAAKINGKENAKIETGKLGRTTTIIYPDANPETNTMDAYYPSGGACGNSWAQNHDCASSSVAGDTVTSESQAVSFRNAAASFRIFRSHFYFYTNVIAASDTITTATFSTFVTSKGDSDNDANAYIAVVSVDATAISSATAANVNDYNDSTTNEMHDASERKDITSISTSAYLDFALNATGIARIARAGETIPTGAVASGVTYFALREGHDIQNDPYDGASGTLSGIDGYFADQTGTTNDPMLTITHEAGAATGAWMFNYY